MKTITITIKLENAAFAEKPAYEVSRILRELADSYVFGDDLEYKKFYDQNGNAVGRVIVL